MANIIVAIIGVIVIIIAAGILISNDGFDDDND